MKARFGLTSQSRSAMLKEIKRQVREQDESFVRSVDAVYLWALHIELRFGKKRLERFYKTAIRIYKEMCKFYEMDDTFPIEYKLREMGIDLDKLRKENT